MSTPPALQLREVHKTFGRGAGVVNAVDGVNLTIQPGEIVAFLGPNGAGKTTTIDMVLGLTTPSSGSIEVFGEPPAAAVRHGRVSAVLQTGGLLRDLTVGETVRVIASLHGTLDRVDDVIDRTGLAKIARRRVSKCSGGEQQRLRFALALLPEPDLLILDEPTAGMDVSARQEFWRTMRLETTSGRTVVFATHYLEEAERFADRIVLISQGQIVADGPTAEIRSITNVRVLTAAVNDPNAALHRLNEHPGVVEAEERDGRLVVQAHDSDQVATLLLNELHAHDLLIAAPSLDDAFLHLTTKEQS